MKSYFPSGIFFFILEAIVNIELFQCNVNNVGGRIAQNISLWSAGAATVTRANYYVITRAIRQYTQSTVPLIPRGMEQLDV